MFQRVIFIFACALLFSGCATVAPLQPEVASKVKQSKVAVVFYDGSEQINYIEDKYLVLGVAQVASNSVYHGVWDSNRDLTTLHTQELGKLGVPATSLYDIFSDVEIAQAYAQLKEMYTRPLSSAGKPLSAPPVTPQLAQMLIAKGYDHLIAINWTGYTLHLQTLGLPMLSKTQVGFRFLDLTNPQPLLWIGSILIWEEVEIANGTGKDFLEKNDLAGLKAEVARLFHERYRIRTDHGGFNTSIGQIVGLEPKVASNR